MSREANHSPSLLLADINVKATIALVEPSTTSSSECHDCGPEDGERLSTFLLLHVAHAASTLGCWPRCSETQARRRRLIPCLILYNGATEHT